LAQALLDAVVAHHPPTAFSVPQRRIDAGNLCFLEP
jgi:hypothetical protein